MRNKFRDNELIKRGSRLFVDDKMIEQEFKKKRKTLKLFFIYFFLLMSVSILASFSFIMIMRKNRIEVYRDISKGQLLNQKDLLLNNIRSIKSDLDFLPRMNEMIRYKELNEEVDRKEIEREFVEFIKSKKIYDQLRYIDINGFERVRVNYNSGDPIIIESDNLQNKKNRYYFIGTISLDMGDFFISHFDLNVEYGEVEIPFKPMIRFGTPIFDKDNYLKGVLIINYLGENIIRGLKEATQVYPGTFSLLDLNSYWLFNNDPQVEWGFMFPEKEKLSFATFYPEEWEKIKNQSESQIVIKERILTSLIISPFEKELNDLSRRKWILMNTISFEEIGLGRDTLIKYFFSIVMLSSIIVGLFAYLLASVIVQRKILRENIKYSALYDGLTKLPNRKLFEERLNETLKLLNRYSHIMALFFIDLDGFKKANDTYGHQVGDRILIEVAQRLISAVRSSDTVARFGGDEFVIILPKINEKDNCKLIADKILKRLKSAFSIDNENIYIGASIGIVVWDPDFPLTKEELIKKADTAMYDVKSKGKNNYKIV